MFQTTITPALAPARPARRIARRHQLVEALIALADGHGIIRNHEERCWASITFSGARHRITLEFSGEEAIAGGDQLIALAPDHEFDLSRELVADLAICAVDHRFGLPPVLSITLEALLLVES